MASQFSKRTGVSTIALSVVLAAAASGANAQDQARQRNEIQELVVTAERRTENLQSTPISATVLSGETLEAKGLTGLSSVQFAAPGIMISDYGSANTFNIRGIGQARVDADLPSGVVIYRDGVPTLTGYFQNAPFFDMQSVEVLRGPQGTFGGKSSSAGAVFIRSRDPELGRFTGSVVLGAGNYESFQGTGIVNIPVGDTVAVRIAYHHERRDSLFEGIRTNPRPGGLPGAPAGPYQGDDDRNLDSIRLGLLWQPDDAFRAVLKLDLDDLRFGSHITSGLDPRTGAIQDIRNPIVNGPHDYRDTGARSSLNLSYEFDNGIMVSSLTGFSTVNTTAIWDTNGADPIASTLFSHGNFYNWSEEINVSSKEDARVHWIIGAFWQRYLNKYDDFDENGFGFAVDNGNRIDFGTPWQKDEKTYAVFGQVGVDVTDKLELQVGARWTHYKFDQFTNWRIDFGAIGSRNATGLGVEGTLTCLEDQCRGHTERFSEKSVDWKVNLNYQATEDHFFYALVSRGHSPGSINLGDPDFFATPDHGAYKEMSVVNYEAGWKGSLLDDQVRTQLSAYYQVFKDYQADFALTNVPGTPANLTLFQFQNATTDSIIWGVEFGAQASIGNWDLDAGIAYSKSKLGSFGLVQNTFSVFYGGPSSIDLDGARTPFAPKVTANVGVAYRFNFGGDGGWTVTPRLDVAYRGDAYARLFQNDATLLKGQTLANAQVRLEKGPWDVTFWVTNLTDREYAGAKQNVDAVGPTFGLPFPHIVGFVYAAPPRLFGVRVGRTF